MFVINTEKNISDKAYSKCEGKANVQDAHEAIRPSKPDVLTIEASADESRLYALIWSRFAASQMSQSIRERRDLEASVEGSDRALRVLLLGEFIAAGKKYILSSMAKSELNLLKLLRSRAKWSIEQSEDSPKMVTDQTKPPRGILRVQLFRP